MEVAYRFLFDGGREEHFTLQFDADDLSLQSGLGDQMEEPWMALSNHQCEGCTLNEREHPLCPVAANLAGW